MAETNKGLFINRYATLAEHRKAVAAAKAKNRITGGQTPKTGKAALSTIDKFSGKTPKVTTKATPSKSTTTSSSKTTTPKPTPKGDGSVKATPRKTSYQKEVEKRNAKDKDKRKRAIDGVGPSDKDRKKNSSPSAMSAAAKRKKNFDGVGPSDKDRRKQSSPAAMSPRAGATRTITKNGKKVQQMWNGKRWVTGTIGGKG